MPHKTLIPLLAALFLLGLQGLPGVETAHRAGAATAEERELVVIRYHRFDGDYDRPTLWTWDPGQVRQPDDAELRVAGRDDFGVYFQLDPSKYGDPDTGPESIGFIARLRQDWNHKDGADRFWSPDLGNEIWLIGNDPRIYTERPDISPRIARASIDGPDLLVIALSHPMEFARMTPERFSVQSDRGGVVPVRSARPLQPQRGEARFVELRLGHELDVKTVGYIVAAQGYSPTTATLRRILDNPALFGTDDPMGAIYTSQSTTFRVFSPMAEDMAVVLYDNPTGSEGRREIRMTKRDDGVWETEVEGDLEGTHYRLRVTTAEHGTQEVNDPEATNTTGFDGHARITDLRALDPEGFRPAQRPRFGNSPTDAIIYEIHVRDFTISPNSGVRDELKGKYLGFVEPGTHLPDHPDIATGIEHLKEMGVTHVQILPIQDFDNDERNPTYNWGYMTAFFNSPEGWFSSDFRNESRVGELKQMIKALHDAGIGVILDVVYNHTGTQATFEQVAPGYYHRMREDGSFWNGSGTGNEFRTEAPMARKFLLDSCRFWIEEYGVDGFRFDLMALIDYDTLIQLKEDLRAIDPNLLLYGEPWAATGPDGSGLDRLVYKNDLGGTGIGAFNDHFRNALKGFPDGPAPGYIHNGTHRNGVKSGIAGSIDDWTANPTESINYATCHDNLTLWDKHLETMPGMPEEEYRKMQMLTAGILAVSQGVFFLHAGAEMGRTKGGDHNSYNAGDEVNQIEWERKKHFAEMVEFHKGIIALRRAHPVFRLATAQEVRERIYFHEDNRPEHSTIVFTLNGEGVEGESWKQAAVFINPSTESQTFAIPSGEEFGVYVLDSRAGTESFAAAKGTIDVPARSMAVLGR